MREVKIRDFIHYLEPGLIYGFRSDVGKAGIEIYPDTSLTGEPVAKLDYTYEEWCAFLKKHHCNLDGDYINGNSNNRRMHDEREDEIHFSLACGKDVIEDCICDWIKIADCM